MFRVTPRAVFVAIALATFAQFLTHAPIAKSAEGGASISAIALTPLPQLYDIGVLPNPRHVVVTPNCALDGASVAAALRSFARTRGANSGALRDATDVVLERYAALGLRSKQSGASEAALRFRVVPLAAAQSDEAYSLEIDQGGIDVGAPASNVSGSGFFYAMQTLAQLAHRDAAGRLSLACVAIDDAPALRWRILSDDISRGPLPSHAYFEERIRTIASLKMNGYSPYMEHVFLDELHPLPAPLDGITPAELSALAKYAARYHVAFIPEQQTFAHMHESLRWERYAPDAELPHGWLLSPQNPAGEAYAKDLIASELAAVPNPPFFHIGSDEPSDLGRGLSKPMVDASGDGPVYAKHVLAAIGDVAAHSRARPMIWDDALSRHPELFSQLPKTLVFVNWHYGSEKTYAPYIDRIASAGFDQMVAPGALNWNQIYPDLDGAFANIGTFASEGKARGVLGLFQTVWHDDGETLFEETWLPVAFAAANAWQSDSVSADAFSRAFPHAFFGIDGERERDAFTSDFRDLARDGTLVRDNPREYGDYLFWSDPFEADLHDALDPARTTELRLAAERVVAHLKTAPPPPLHPASARAMEFAALRYDLLGRDIQIADEARTYYDLARANLDRGDSYVYRNLLVAKYLFWEQRDRFLELEPLAKQSWEYENRASHERSVLERYHVAADRAIVRADALNDTTYREYVAHKRLPPFDDAIGLQPAPVTP